MTPAEALEIVVARTGHGRFRELCDPAHPDYHPGCPGEMLRLAHAGPPPSPPPLMARLANFAGSLASHVAAGLPQAPPELKTARLKVCEAGGPNGSPCPQRLPGGTCAACGCNLILKSKWLDSTCPIGKWPDPD